MTLEAQIIEIVASAVSSELGRVIDLAERKTDVDGRCDGEKRLWTEVATAQLCSISPLTLKRMRLDGRVRPHRGRKPILYSAAGIDSIVKVLGDEE